LVCHSGQQIENRLEEPPLVRVSCPCLLVVRSELRNKARELPPPHRIETMCSIETKARAGAAQRIDPQA
jgi:hypothetical protein